MSQRVAITAGLGKYFQRSNVTVKLLKTQFETVINLTDYNFEKVIATRLLELCEAKKIEIKSHFIWKPLLILSVLESLEDGTEVFYVDSGTDLVLDRNFEKLIEGLQRKDHIFFTNRLLVKEWCCEEVYLDLKRIHKITHDKLFSPAAGIIFLKKNQQTMDLLKYWANLAVAEGGRFQIGNNKSFHRHDQVTLSFTLDHFEVAQSDYPIFFPFNQRHQNQILDWPIHTTRNKRSNSIHKHPNRLVRLIRGIIRSDILEYYLLRAYFSCINVFINKQVQIESFCNTDISMSRSTSEFVTSGDDRRRPLIINRMGPVLNNCIINNTGRISIKTDQKNIILKDFERRFFLRQSRKVRFIDHFKNLYRLLVTRSAKKINSGVLCLNADSDNLYHFLWDCLSCIPYSGQTGDNLFLLSNGLKGLKSSLMNKNNIKFSFVDSEVYCSELHTPNIISYSGEPSLEQIANLRLYFECFDKAINKYPEKVFIIRRKGRSVILTTEQENFLNESQFVFIDLAELDIQEQILLFQNAKTIIAPHGAGLSWIFLCQENCKIIEFNNGLFRNDCFFNIAKKINLDFTQITGLPAHCPEKNEDPNIVIDDFAFEKLKSELRG